MGMSVKGLGEHRLIALGLRLALSHVTTDEDRARVQRLRRRADLGIARCKQRKPARARRQSA